VPFPTPSEKAPIKKYTLVETGQSDTVTIGKHA
jgi:hypothetical protein